jgi:hypothetical protein
MVVQCLPGRLMTSWWSGRLAMVGVGVNVVLGDWVAGIQILACTLAEKK